jgi:hypothetical protein
MYLELFDEWDFAKKVVKIHKTLVFLEKSKYLEPMLSKSFEHLAEYLKT